MQDRFQDQGHSLVEMDQALDRLARVMGTDSFKLAQLLGDRANDRFVKIAEKPGRFGRRTDRSADLPGVGTLAQSARCYPMGSIAAHLLGAAAPMEQTGRRRAEI